MTNNELPKNTKAALAYAGIWITGLIFLLTEKKDEFIRFHAMQSLVTFAGLTIITMVPIMVPIIGWMLAPFIAILGFIVWLVCMIKAYQGEKFKLPIVGDFSEEQLKKMK